MEKLNLKENEVLVLRKCKEDFTSYIGFLYPEKGYVEAPDWELNKKYSNGLSGLEWGIGGYPIDDNKPVWQVIRVDKNNGYVDLKGMVKFKCGEVILSTLDQKEATDLLMEYAPNGLKNKVGYRVIISRDNSIIFCGHSSIIISGHNSVIASEYYSDITSGDKSNINSEHNSIITSRDYSTITCGNYSTVTSGDYSNITCGKCSIITSKDYSIINSEGYVEIKSGDFSKIACGAGSTIFSGDESTITCGNDSKIFSGYWSTITSGNNSIITSGRGSTITSGDNSTVTIIGNNVTFTLGKGSRVMTNSSVFIEGIDFKANEKVVVEYDEIVHTLRNSQ